MRPVLVHGGGKPIDRAMAAAGLQAAQGPGPPLHRRRHPRHRRPRPAATRSTPASCRRSAQLGGRAVGLHTGSLQCLFGEKLLLPGDDGQPIDLGRVGKVTRVDCAADRGLLRGRRRAGDSVAGPRRRRAAGSTSTPTPPPPPWPRTCRPRSWSSSPTRPASCATAAIRDVAGPQPRRRRLPRPDAPRRHRRGHDPQGRGVPGQPARRRQQDAHDRRPAAGIRCCWRSTPTAASARRSCCGHV